MRDRYADWGYGSIAYSDMTGAELTRALDNTLAGEVDYSDGDLTREDDLLRLEIEFIRRAIDAR